MLRNLSAVAGYRPRSGSEYVHARLHIHAAVHVYVGVHVHAGVHVHEGWADQGGGLPVTWRLARLTFAVFWISVLMNVSSSVRCAAPLGAFRFVNSAQTSTR